MKDVLVALLAMITMTAPAVAQGPLAPPLIDWRGMTLYINERDTAERSHCEDQCALDWPPHLAADDAQISREWTTVVRRDGYKQWAYKGKPVYRSAKDRKPGETHGDGVDNTWRVARP